jgi:hypothetical protein
MSPKKKAEELYDKFLRYVRAVRYVRAEEEFEHEYAKQYALIAVELRIDAYCCPPVGGIEWAEKKEQYWQNVKQELDKM